MSEIDRDAPWRSFPIVVLDVEATGLDTQEDRVVELAGVRFEPQPDGSYARTESIVRRVNPGGRPIDPEATEAHGITDADVADAPSFVEVWPLFVALCAGAIVGAFNAKYDRGILRAEHERAAGGPGAQLVVDGVPLTLPLGLRIAWLDPAEWIWKIDRYVKGDKTPGAPGRHSLVATAARWQIPLVRAHAAEDDAIATGLILTSARMAHEVAVRLRGARRVGVVPPPIPLREVLDMQARISRERQADYDAFSAKRDAQTACRDCQAPIRWLRDKHDRAYPVQAPGGLPDELATLRISDNVVTPLRADDAREARRDGETLWVLHRDACPARRAPEEQARDLEAKEEAMTEGSE